MVIDAIALEAFSILFADIFFLSYFCHISRETKKRGLPVRENTRFLYVNLYCKIKLVIVN